MHMRHAEEPVRAKGANNNTCTPERKQLSQQALLTVRNFIEEAGFYADKVSGSMADLNEMGDLIAV